MPKEHRDRLLGRGGQVDPGKQGRVRQDLRRRTVVMAIVTLVVTAAMVVIGDDPAVLVVVVMTVHVDR
ncbi:hypothetical protein [Brevundimonas sp.]|uniref:hypothetical protein n=1 Tax=Brevundimonas sp. TaxID=1871086 RepID=UPI00262C2B3F|nr:hypothetical protein [Brevundimonas sp.]